jgi:sphingomyelin phosphodiesterase acid-like 3
MRFKRKSGGLRAVLEFGLGAILIAAYTAGVARSQNPAPQSEASEHTIPALMVSDIHFEPFWDPEKAAQLAAAPVKQWKEILAASDSPGRADKFAALEQSCKTRGEDTTYRLFDSSLRAMREHATGARFITVSGDLMSHAFTCKFATVFPTAAPDDYRAFAEKTVGFVVESLRGAFPGIPVYAALGNNDSGCGDYQLDANSDFLSDTGKVITADLRGPERERATQNFAAGGYYSAELPAPMEHTRLLVLDDLFMSRRYQNCAGKDDSAPAAAQIAWLKMQLDEARDRHEKIWVLAHIPPGVDPYSTVTKGKNICKGNPPQMYLSSEALPEAIAEFGDVIKLAIFAHTHMDEVRLLEPAKTDSAKAGAAELGVPVKMVSSISPIDGNNPSFTVARVDPEKGQLEDYRVFVASNQTGIDATWSEEYDFAKTYKEPSFSAPTLLDLIARFDADRGAQSSDSQDYIHNYGAGGTVKLLQLVWPQYVCALQNDEGDAFSSCVCAMKP